MAKQCPLPSGFFNCISIGSAFLCFAPPKAINSSADGFLYLCFCEPLNVFSRFTCTNPPMLRLQFQWFRLDVIPNRTEENTLPPLRNSAVCCIQQEQLNPIADLFESSHHQFRVAFGVAQKPALSSPFPLALATPFSTNGSAAFRRIILRSAGSTARSGICWSNWLAQKAISCAC